MKRDYNNTAQNNKDFRTKQHYKDYVLVNKLYEEGNFKEVSRLVKERDVSKYFRDNNLLNMASKFNHTPLIKTLLKIPDAIQNDKNNQQAFDKLLKNKNNEMISEFVKKDLYKIDLEDIEKLKSMVCKNELWYLEAYIDTNERYKDIKKREQFKIQAAYSLPLFMSTDEAELQIRTYCNKTTPSLDLMEYVLFTNQNLFYGMIDKAIDTFDDEEKKALITTVLKHDSLEDNIDIVKDIIVSLKKQDIKLELKIKEIDPDYYHLIVKDRVKQNVMNF